MQRVIHCKCFYLLIPFIPDILSAYTRVAKGDFCPAYCLEWLPAALGEQPAFLSPPRRRWCPAPLRGLVSLHPPSPPTPHLALC